MMDWKRWLILSFLILFGIAPPLAAKRILIDQAAIIVNNKMMTRLEVEAMKDLQEKEIKATYKGEELETKLNDFRKELIDQMVNNLILAARAEELNIDVSDKEIEDRVKAIHQRDPRVSGVYSDNTLRELVVKDLLNKRVLQREVYSRVLVDEKEIKQACLSDNGDNRELDIGHILLKGYSSDVITRIKGIRKMLEEGADFEKIALEQSEDPSATQNKGRLGFVSKGQFVKPFEEKAFSLGVGELSEPVKTKFGYHLIKLFGERKKEDINCDELDDIVRRKYNDRLWNEKQQAMLKKYFSELKESAVIKVLYKP